MELDKIDQELQAELQDLAAVLIRRRRPAGYRRFLRRGKRLAEAARQARRQAQDRRRRPTDFWGHVRVLGRRLVWLLIWLHLVFVIDTLLISLVFRFVNPAATAFMAYRAVVNRHTIEQPIWLSLTKLPSSTIKSFIYLEDSKFYRHFGFNLEAIRAAAKHNAAARKIVAGGSTISQQLARNLFLVPNRTWFRKYLEVYATLIVEAVLGKRRILALYLNYIEFGPGAFGLGRGAYYQYGRPFGDLSLDERLRLAVIIASPLRYTVTNFHSKPGLAARYRTLLRWYRWPVQSSRVKLPDRASLPEADLADSPDAQPLPKDQLAPNSELPIPTGSTGTRDRTASEQSASPVPNQDQSLSPAPGQSAADQTPATEP